MIIGLIYIRYIITLDDHFSLSPLEQSMMLSLVSYSAYSEVAKSWDQLQVENKCCGVHNYSDWFGLSLHGHFYDSYKLESPNGVPVSCCKQLTVGCGRNVTNPENIDPTGCLKSLSVHIENQINKSVINWTFGCNVVMLIIAFITVRNCIAHTFRREDGCKDKRRRYNHNNDIENTPLIEKNVSNEDGIDIEDEAADTDVLINIRDDEENEYNGNQVSSVNMGTTVIHTPDVHRDACTYSDGDTL